MCVNVCVCMCVRTCKGFRVLTYFLQAAGSDEESSRFGIVRKHLHTTQVTSRVKTYSSQSPTNTHTHVQETHTHANRRLKDKDETQIQIPKKV